MHIQLRHRTKKEKRKKGDRGDAMCLPLQITERVLDRLPTAASLE